MYHIPPETFMASEHPRPVSGWAAEVSQRIIDVVFRCLAPALPDIVPAGAFSTSNNRALGGTTSAGQAYVSYIYGGGGYGGNAEGDGLTNAPSTVLSGRPRQVPPFGLHGGEPGACTEVVLTLDGQEHRPEHVTKFENVELNPGDRVRVANAGGGGWGDPRDRDPQAIRHDVAMGYLTGEEAQARYDVRAELFDDPAPNVFLPEYDCSDVELRYVGETTSS